jgi:hypothetical protein
MQKVMIPALLSLLVFSLVLTGCSQAAAPAAAAASAPTIDETRLPVATAYIFASGNVKSSSGNIIASRSTTGVYQVDITGVRIDSSYTIILTPAQNSKTYMNSYLKSGNLECAAYDDTGTPTNTDFNLVIWQNKVVN